MRQKFKRMSLDEIRESFGNPPKGTFVYDEDSLYIDRALLMKHGVNTTYVYAAFYDSYKKEQNNGGWFLLPIEILQYSTDSFSLKNSIRKLKREGLIEQKTVGNENYYRVVRDLFKEAYM